MGTLYIPVYRDMPSVGDVAGILFDILLTVLRVRGWVVERERERERVCVCVEGGGGGESRPTLIFYTDKMSQNDTL